MPDNNYKVPMDAYVEVKIETNKQSAYMVVHEPRNGGKEITPEQIIQEIKYSNVEFGLEDMDYIQAAFRTIGYEHRIVIANWKQPMDGQNGYVEYHYDQNKVAKPTEDEHGNVDYKDLGLITNILRGTKIATIHEPTEGEGGFNVTGEPIPQKPGVPAKYSLGKGTKLSPDGNYIVADVDGNLAFRSGRFEVTEDLIISGDVGFSTGNIDFIGNVNIGGNVFEGFKVISKKNITINGMCTSATLQAGGNVTVKLGCLQSNVNCKGSFTANFCENSRIKSNGDVQANSFISCEVFTGGKIVAGGKGTISGGSYTAIDDIKASVIGSDHYVKTDITVGNNAILTSEREKATARLEKMEDALRQLTMVIDMLTERQKQGITLSPKHEQMKSESLRTKLMTQKELKKMYARIEEIDNELSQKQNISVVCKRRFYPGTTIRIDAYTYTVSQIYENCKATVVGNKIVMEPIR